MSLERVNMPFGLDLKSMLVGAVVAIVVLRFM